MTLSYGEMGTRAGSWSSWQTRKFREGIERLQARVKEEGYRSVFQNISRGDLGTTVYALWVNLESGKYLLTFTNNVGNTDYYDTVERV